jgi:PAS domain-containing protein
MDGETRRRTAPAFGRGEMGPRVLAHDWAATPLGPIAGWPATLRVATEFCLGALQPVYVAWGPQQTSLYNDGYIPILGDKHPRALGAPYAEVWPEIAAEFQPVVEAIMAGEAVHAVDRPVPLGGGQGRPMSWFTFSWTPLRDDRGEVAGFYCAATETTERVLAEQALQESEERFRRLVEG